MIYAEVSFFLQFCGLQFLLYKDSFMVDSSTLRINYIVFVVLIY